MNLITFPKYIRMIVSGTTNYYNDTKRIILLTDKFFSDSCRCEFSGPEKEFIDLYQKAAGLYSEDDEISFSLSQFVRDKIGFVYTNYVKNDWGMNFSLDGPSGWIHPNGRIYFDDDIGKYPSLFEIIDDWTNLARAFPYLDLVATLFSGSIDEYSTPLIDIIVQNGKVTTERVSSLRNHQRFTRNSSDIDIEKNAGKRLGVSLEWYAEFAMIIRQAMELDNDWEAIDDMNKFIASYWSQV